MHLPAGSVDYDTVKANLDRMRLDNFEKTMQPRIIKPDQRAKLTRKRRNKVRRFDPDLELIVFPCGILAADGSFLGALGLCAHLQRLLASVAD